MKIPKGLCQCGCGGKTKISKRNRKERGQLKGEPVPYRQGHGAINNTKHGQSRRKSRTPEYSIYQAAIQRCTNPKDKDYHYYGGRGIKFLFKSFQHFFDTLGRKPKGRSLDRINNGGNYEPGNVRWATKKQQANNQRKKGTCLKQCQLA